MPGRLDANPVYLQDPSYVTSYNSENTLPSSTFEANAGYSFDADLGAHDDLFAIGPTMHLSQRAQYNFGLPAIAESHIPGPSLELLQPPDTLTALARLNGDIAKQISNVDVYFWGPVNTGQHCIDKLHQTEGNPVAEMLKSTSRLVDILEKLAPLSPPPKELIAGSVALGSTTSDSGNSSSASGRKQTSPRAPRSPAHSSSTSLSLLSTPVVLMLLSSYILLLELYSAIFSRVNGALSQIGDISNFLQGLPEVQVAGLPPVKAQLYAKIIIQIIDHNFDQLERLLGLPEEFGLSERTPDSKGLLSTTDLSQLLHTAMTQVTGNHGTSGSSTLRSFRANLRGLRGMLLR
ncbi:hypothetical protein AYO22_03093 [Fonsecaea multimorphosa]|nr:hypothetical protein AYO22_03093 [Fonsecaea multimorphosa]